MSEVSSDPKNPSVQVTPLFSLTSETFCTKNKQLPPTEEPRFFRSNWLKPELSVVASEDTQSGPISRFRQTHSFCDWLSIKQGYPEGNLPVINDGAFVCYDGDGAYERTTLRKLAVEGSHETRLFVRCDGTTVEVEGNVSRLGRPDNVFGFTFAQCLQRVNALLLGLGLPPFTEGKQFEVVTPNGYAKHWTGARVNRIDLTQNFRTGSKQAAHSFMHHLAGQQAARMKTGVFGDGETVDFGRGSRRHYSKAYLKGPEILRHIAKSQKRLDSSALLYLNKLADFCTNEGLVRFETTYKQTWLINNGLNFLGTFDMNVIEADFRTKQEVLTRASAHVDDLSDLPKNLLAVYRMWQAGDDLTEKFSRATYFRHRRALLPYGVDIAIKSSVTQFKPRVQVIQLEPLAMPDFYAIPQPTFIRLAA